MEATASFGLGRELEAGGVRGSGFEPGLGLRHFSLRHSGVSPSFFPGTPPPEEVSVFWDTRLARPMVWSSVP